MPCGLHPVLGQKLASRQIPINEVAPGDFWTPLQPATGWPDERIVAFGAGTSMGRAGEPADIAPCLCLLASEEGRHVTGRTLRVNEGVYCG